MLKTHPHQEYVGGREERGGGHCDPNQDGVVASFVHSNPLKGKVYPPTKPVGVASVAA